MSLVGTGYEFMVTYQGIDRMVYPIGYRGCSVKWEEQQDLIFLRQKFNGELIFVNDQDQSVDDFDFFFGIDRDIQQRCNEIIVNIYHNGTLCFSGYFTVNKGKFDVDGCIFKVTPEANDKYKQIFAGWKVEYNLIDIALKVSAITPLETYTECRWLMDAFEFLAQKMIPTATIQSVFFDSADATTDYVTLTDTQINHVMIAQKSDIITPDATEPATKAMLSWSGLMDIIRIMFNAYWIYDEDTNKIIIEHVSYFDASEEVDIRSEELARAKKKYSYDSIKIPKKETFEMMEAHKNAAKTDFKLNSIVYSTNCVGTDDSSQEINYNLPVTTDIEWLQDAQGNTEASNEGFVLIATEADGADWNVILSTGYLSLVDHLNAPLSWANLLMNYHRHRRPFISGAINGHEMDFCTTTKYIRQEEFYIENCDCPFDPDVKFKTELGDEVFNGEFGYPSDIEQTFLGKVKLALRYGDPENVNQGVPEPEIVQWGMFPTANSDNPLSYCLAEGGCDAGALAMAYINTTTQIMYWDAAGVTKINATAATRYYFIGCYLFHDEGAPWADYYGYNYYYELDLDSKYVTLHECT